MDPLVDLADVQRLIEIVERHGLDGLTVADEDVEIAISAQQPPSSEVAAAAQAVAETGPPANVFQLKSPITGVFYRSPSPSDPLFVQVGDLVEEEDTVCLIEAMKIFNEIPAGYNGRLVRVVAQNEQLVVTGEVLMEFEPVEAAS